MQPVSVARPSRFVDVLGIVSVVLGLLLGLVPGIGPIAARADHTDLGAGQFEIDGNIAGTNDWAGIAGELAPDGTGNTDPTFFKASLTEASYPNWEFVTGANAPKADLHRIFVHSQLTPNGNFVWLGATRVSDQGNVQVTAEFNKLDLSLASLEGDYRSVGDFYIRFNFPGNTGGAVDASIAQWTGSAWGPETLLALNADFRAATGTLGDDSREFVELEIDLAGLFGDGNEFECGSFGAVSFRTEASGGNDNNNQPTLKDIAGPYPIDLDTCGEITVEKLDEDGNGLTGAEFTLYDGADTTGSVVATCTTDTSGACSFGPQQTGTYTVDETVVPDGYRKADGLPETFEVLANTPKALGPYTDPRIPYTITVEPDGRNAVGNDHLFTVELTDDEGPVVGETVQLAWTGVGEITDVDGGGAATSCTTDADGRCLVTVTSDDAGSGELTATWSTPYQNTTGSAPGNTTVNDSGQGTVAYSDISDAATKLWVGYVATIEADATNLVGDAHTFVATVWEVDGDGAPDGVLADGVTVTVSWDGPDGSTIGSTTCVTGSDDNATGTCTFEVDSPTDAGPGTITITQLDGTIAGIGGQDDEELSDTTPTAAPDGTLSAVKTWRAYRALIDDDSTNPTGQAHTFTVTVQYRDVEGGEWSAAGAGITVDWSGPSPDGSNDLDASSCDDGTDAAGQCTIVVTNDDPGTGTVTVTGIDGDLVPGGDAAESFDVTDVQATKTWLDFTVDIDGPFTNLVGEPETFTVHVQQFDGFAYSDVTDTVVLWDDSTSDLVTGDTCSTGTDGDGECTITVESDTPGTFPISVTGLDDFGGFDTPADVTFTTPAESSKTWVDYRASIGDDGVNLVGDDHTFTVTAQVDDGDGWDAVPDGTVVTVSSSGLAADVDQSDCVDGTTDGTCLVVVDSDAVGTVTVTVATVGNEVAVDSLVTAVDVSDGANLGDGQSASASKTWVAYRAEIEASATNLTGEQHVFTVTAQQDDGSGWAPVPDGTTVGYSTDNDDRVSGSTCASTTDGGCTITVDSAEVDRVTVTVTSVSAEDVDDTPTATVSDGTLSVAPEGSLSATKDWIAARVDVEADATNVAGEDHVFTVHVEIVTPDGTVDAPAGTTATVSTSGTTGAIASQTCDTPGTDADGMCTVTVESDAAGQLTVSVDGVAFTYDDTAFAVDFDDDSSDGEATGQDRTATKTWRAYRVDIEAHDLNRVREAHTFTVTIEQTDDGATWDAVPDGTTATVVLTGTGTGDAGASTCASTGTVDGSCDVVVNSTAPGTLTATVTAIEVDLPSEQRTDISVDVDDDSASKTWAAFRASISDDAVNVTGDDHPFTLTGQYTVDGTTWLDVPDGSVIRYGDTGVGSTSGDTCDSTTDGDCTVTVVSDTGGDRTVTVTGIDPAAITYAGTDGDIVRDFGLVTLADEAVGVAPGTDTDVAATKTWASYTLQLTPAEAVNLLDGTDDDPEQDHVITAVLQSDDAQNAPVGGQDVAVSLTGDTGLITAVEDGSVADGGLSAVCTTDTDGTCDVTITSSTPGTAVLSGSYQAVVGESDPVTVEAADATKVWTTYRVTVEADATNLVGNPHTFTVTVEQSNPAGDCDGDWCAVEGAVPTSTVTGSATITDDDCADDGTGADGTCTVTVQSDTIETVTMTASYEASVGQTTATFTDTGDKTWVDFDIDVDPDTDENLVSTDHVFTVTVTTTFPTEDGTTTSPVADAVPTVELAGMGAITDDGCAEGTDAAGQCTVTISAAAAGSSTLTATYLGTTDDDTEQREYSDSGDKLWVDYALVIDPAQAVNAVDDDHTFTATLTVDTGDGFGPAADETLQFSVEGVGATTGGDVDDALACTTDAAGQCDIVINSDEPGTTTVDVSYGAEVGDTAATFSDEGVKQWADIQLVKTAVIGDGFEDGDLVADDDTGLPTLFFTSSDQGPKTAVFEYVVTNVGPVTLVNVELVDDRLGSVITAADGVTLEPGESTTVRASEQFDYFDAAGGLSNLITNIGVVTADADDGTTVSDLDDAAIQLIAQQSSILLDLDKEVVAGVGDVDDSSGFPTVTWSDEELAAGASKIVRYQLTITNIGPSRIVDLELTDEMLSADPLIAVADGVTLEPGESTTVEVDHVLTAAEAFPDGPTAGEVPNEATARGANETRDAFDEDTDDAVVFVQVVFAEVEEPLPATGLTAGGLLPTALLLITVGAAVLWLNRRRTVLR